MKIETNQPGANLETPALTETPAPTSPAVETPSPAPAAPPAEVSPDAGSEELDWGQMNEDFDKVDLEVDAGSKESPVADGSLDVPVVAPPSTEEAVPPVVPKVETPSTEIPAPATPEVPTAKVPDKPETPPVVPPVAETPTPEVSKAETPAAQAQTPEQQAEALNKVRMEQHSKLKDYYKMSEEDAVAIVTSPNEVVPSMLANLHMTVLENTLQTLTSMIPQMVSQVINANKANEDANKAFFDTWPKLAKKELYAPLGRMIQAYRNANPEVPQDQLISEVGAAAHLAFKIAPDNLPAVPGTEVVPTIPIVPVIPEAGGNFVPAAPGGNVAQVPVGDKNQWTDYNKELDKEEAHG